MIIILIIIVVIINIIFVIIFSVFFLCARYAGFFVTNNVPSTSIHFVIVLKGITFSRLVLLRILPQVFPVKRNLPKYLLDLECKLKFLETPFRNGPDCAHQRTTSPQLAWPYF